MKKKYKRSYTHTSKTIKNQVALYKKRLNTVNIIWCNQVIDFIQNSKIKSIKDIGCNYFQFYKELKLRKIKTKYFGYDIDDHFIKLGLVKFPELKKKYKIGNCENIKLLKTDFSIMSAVLEHVENPIKLLNNVISSTRKIICIRTYLGAKSYKAVANNFKNQILPYNCNQFSFKDIEYKLKKKGFKVFFILDKAANYSQFRLIDNKYKRFMYIAIGIKN